MARTQRANTSTRSRAGREPEPAPVRRGAGGPPQAAGSPEPTLLFLTGFLATAGGLALAAAPGLSPQLGKVTEKLAEMGLHTGALMMGGMILLALGMLSRALANVAEGGRSDSDTLLEQLGEDQATLRTVCARMEQRLGQLAQTVQGLGEAGEQSGAKQEESESSDALWRLAASLDQLGARLEKGLDGHIRTLEQRIAGVVSALERPGLVPPDVPPEALPEAPPEAGSELEPELAETTFLDGPPAPAEAGDAGETAAEVDAGAVAAGGVPEPEQASVPPEVAEAADADAGLAALERAGTDLFGALDDIEFLKDEPGPGAGLPAVEAGSGADSGGSSTVLDLDALDASAFEDPLSAPEPPAPLPAAPSAADPAEAEPEAPGEERPAVAQDLDALLPDDEINSALERERRDG